MPFIEEVDDEDIDNKHFGIEEFDQHNPFSKDMPMEEGAPVQLVPTSAKKPASSQPAASATPATVPGLGSFNDAVTGPPGSSRTSKQGFGKESPEHVKNWKVLYPIYFDKNRTVKQGRRVPIEFAVDNPSAVTIADAVRLLGYEPALESSKTHPKDWANPGRVRIDMGAGQCKREIYGKIAKALKAMPVNAQSARESMYRQFAQFDSSQPLARPRNMPMPKISPGVSPALSTQKFIEESMKMDGNEMAKLMGMG